MHPEELPVLISLAPMEGVIDSVMRHLLTLSGDIDLCTTEFIRVSHQELPDHVFFHYCPELQQKGRTLSGTPVFVQLLGGNAEMMKINAQKAVSLGAYGIDLNFGCPAKTVNRHDGGAILLKDPLRIHQIVSSVRKGLPSHIPLMAKVRLGFDHKEKALDIARAVADGGAQRLTVHARTRMELYQPPAHWEYIAQMREVAGISVIANGDIWNVKEFLRCQSISGCDSFAIGRPVIACPDLPQQIKAHQKKQIYFPHHWEKIKKDYLLPMISFTQKQGSERLALARAKQWLRHLAKNYSEALRLFDQLKISNDLSHLIDVLLRHETHENNEKIKIERKFSITSWL